MVALMLQEELVNQIAHSLTFLSTEVALRNSMNLTDLNLHAEDFYCELLNSALGYKLHNINAINPNASAIDLAGEDDKGASVAIQVTSTSDITKTRETVDKFIVSNLHKQYNRLIILNLIKTKKHREPWIGQAGVYQLDTRTDIWDIYSLIRKIQHQNSANLQKIADFLQTELKLLPPEKPSKEVATFLTLIKLLSDETHIAAGRGFIEDPDPTGKIYKRFADHAKFLTDQYMDLYTQYGNVLQTVKNNMDIGTVRFDRMGLYLKNYSDTQLTQSGGDPRAALEKIVTHFASLLARQGVDYDDGAIRFFLLDQTIACNVFPNEEAIRG
jgi:hypothetical protein